MRNKRGKRYLLCVLAALISTTFAVDLPMTEGESLPNATPMPQTLSQAQSPSTTAPQQNAQIWNLKNADIRAVIQTISILTGKNFIIDPKVDGKITLMSQKPMTPNEMYQVFLSMLQLLHYSAIPSGNIIKIVPAADANSLARKIATNAAPGTGEEIVVRVVPVQRVSATELVPVLRPLMPQSGSITAYLPSNSLILAGTASNITRLLKVVDQMDSDNASQVGVIPLHYANAKKVVAMIQALHNGPNQVGTNNATLVADEEDNSVLINANSTNQLLTRQLIAQLDRPQAVNDDTRVVMLNYLTAKKVAPILTKIANGESATSAATTSTTNTSDSHASANDSSFGGNNVSVQPEDSDNALIIHAPKAMMSSLLRVIQELDHRPEEVLVEAIIVKVDQNLLNKLGIQWGTPDGALAAAVATGTIGTGALPSINASGDVLLKMGSGGVGFLPSGNLLALIHMLKSDGSTDVLSTPSVVVLNNDKATIDDGQNIGVANRSYQGTTPTETAGTSPEITSPYNTIERQDVTLSLNVTPHISPNNMIRMDLLQKDDTVASNLDPNNDNPTLNTSKIKTTVMVRSGSILVLGGLISNNQEKTTQKIPVLGNIPVLGHFFTYDSTKIDKTSLMVFIRPIVLSGRVAKQETSGRYRYMRDQQITNDTESVEDNLKTTILPKLNDNRKVALPSPVKSIALPIPVKTEE